MLLDLFTRLRIFEQSAQSALDLTIINNFIAFAYCFYIRSGIKFEQRFLQSSSA